MCLLYSVSEPDELVFTVIVGSLPILVYAKPYDSINITDETLAVVPFPVPIVTR